MYRDDYLIRRHLPYLTVLFKNPRVMLSCYDIHKNESLVSFISNQSPRASPCNDRDGSKQISRPCIPSPPSSSDFSKIPCNCVVLIEIFLFGYCNSKNVQRSICSTLIFQVSPGFPTLTILRLGQVDEFEKHETALKPRIDQLGGRRVTRSKLTEGVGQQQRKYYGGIKSRIQMRHYRSEG